MEEYPNVLDLLHRNSFTQVISDLTGAKNVQLVRIAEERSAALANCWPKTPGVYVVSYLKNPENQVLYIGMAGSVKADGNLNKSLLSGRMQRWTPYSFSFKQDHFSYSPIWKGSGRELRNVADYHYHVPLKQVVIDCFSVADHRSLAPSFLEALLLQKYLAEHGCLPPANRIF